MYEIKTLKDNYVCYCEGTHNVAYTQRNYKKTTTITGRIITEKVANRKYITITIAKMLESQYNILVDIFNYSNDEIILTDLTTNEIFTDLFIDGEELRLNKGTLSEAENNEITYFSGDIIFMERG